MNISEPPQINDDYLVSQLGFKGIMEGHGSYPDERGNFVFADVDFEQYVVFYKADFIIARRRHEEFYHLMVVAYMADENQYMQQITQKGIQYLHQLQNLYFAIMGEELIVK